MKRLENLIGAAQMVLGIEEGKPYIEAPPTGLLDPVATDAPPVIVNIYNQCLTDKARLTNSDAYVTLHVIAAGKSEATRNYWKYSEAFHKTLGDLEKLLKPLPSTPNQIKAVMGKITPLLKSSDTCSQAVLQSLTDMKAEIDVLAGKTAIA